MVVLFLDGLFTSHSGGGILCEGNFQLYGHLKWQTVMEYIGNS